MTRKKCVIRHRTSSNGRSVWYRKKKFFRFISCPASIVNIFAECDTSNRETHVRALVDIELSRNLSHRNFYLPSFLSFIIIESTYCIHRLSSCDFFFVRFGSGEPLNRARWHNSRSRQSPTCYHRRRQRIVKPRIVQQLRVTPRVRRSSSRAKIAVIRDAIGEMSRRDRWLGHSNFFEFL